MSRSQSSPPCSSEEEANECPNFDGNYGEIMQAQQGFVKAPSSPSPTTTAHLPPKPPKSPPLLQKRRRVTRACDECRRKKIKCDGRQPCTHCTVYSYDCTYDQPSNRRRNPTPQYIEALERRLHRAETLLRAVLPEIDLDDVHLDADLVRSGDNWMKQGRTFSQPLARDDHPPKKSPGDVEQEQESLLESMVANTGSLDLDERGHWDFHGHSSGLVFLRRMRDQLGGLMGQSEGNGLPFLQTRNLSLALESPRSTGDTPSDSGLPNIHELPPKEHARKLCQNALDDACALMRFVHQPSFYSMLDRVYDVRPENFGDNENRFLPLLYAAIAVGYLFAKEDYSQLQVNGYESAIDHGFQWFRASRQLMEITDCRDLTSLQAVLFMIMFLQSSARLSTCYSHIGIALRSAIRMGLHRSVSIAFNPVEREIRKRVFWVIRKMDTYVGALLGLPQILSDDDIDQEMPLEVDDEFITAGEILRMPSGRVSVMAAFNAHTRLVMILSKTAKYIYPIKGFARVPQKSNQSYAVKHERIQEIEQDLQDWMEGLPAALRPGAEATPALARTQQLLRMAYAHVQMFLYRPFLHYLSSHLQTQAIDQRSYACATACVRVSRNIVRIAGEMKKRGLLVGAYWFYMYTTFFAILSLVFYVLENPQSPRSKDILQDAYEGKDTLASLARRSMAADRCTITLATLFRQLPERLNEVNLKNSPPRKRQASPRPADTSKAARSSAPERYPATSSVHTIKNEVQLSNLPTNQNPSSQRKKRLSIAPDAFTSRHQHIRSFDSDAFSATGDTYSPSLPETGGLSTPSSVALNVVPLAPRSTQSMSPDFIEGRLSELPAHMLPSPDPFAYPTQPMTNLENNNFTKQENYFDANMFTPATTNGPYDHLDAQVFGTFPPYILYGEHPAATMQTTHQLLDVNGAGASNSMIISSNEGFACEQQQQEQQELAEASNTIGMNQDPMSIDGWNAAWMGRDFKIP